MYDGDGLRETQYDVFKVKGAERWAAQAVQMPSLVPVGKVRQEVG